MLTGVAGHFNQLNLPDAGLTSCAERVAQLLVSVVESLLCGLVSPYGVPNVVHRLLLVHAVMFAHMDVATSRVPRESHLHVATFMWHKWCCDTRSFQQLSHRSQQPKRTGAHVVTDTPIDLPKRLAELQKTEAALREQIEAALKIHAPDDYGNCRVCVSSWAFEETEPSPCPTARALGVKA